MMLPKLTTALDYASKVTSLPGLNLVSRPSNRKPSDVDLEGYLVAQRLAQEAVKAVSGMIREGLTERRIADLLDTYLRDSGVNSFFHKSFVWFGERTRYVGVKTYFDYLPSGRVVMPGEVYILDVAPIFKGYVCDIGFTASLGENNELQKAQVFLGELRRDLPGMFTQAMRGGDGKGIWRDIDERIRAAGYDNIHALYPFSVLGHRVHRVMSQKMSANFINFGWQSYWEFFSRGLFGQLLNDHFTGDLTGLWAIEPHVGAPKFGAKFEEILVVDKNGARWLD